MYRFSTYKRQYKANLKLALPVVMTQLGQILVQVADNVMVGRYGGDDPTPLAATSFGGSVFFILFIAGVGIALGLTPLIGELYAQGDRCKSSQYLQNGLMFYTLLGFLVCGLQLAVIPLMYHMGQPVEVVDMAIPYYKLLAYSMPFIMLFFTFKQFLEGVGNTKVEMFVTIAANLANIGFNWVFIYGRYGFPEMGAEGAGLGTLMSRIIAPMLMIGYFYSRSKYRVYLEGFSPRNYSWASVRQLLHMGLPISMQMFLEASAFVGTGIMMGWFNKETMSANQIATTIGNCAFMIVMSIGAATTIRVSHCYGARDIVRALVHTGVQDALRRDSEPFADRQLAGGAHLHPAEHVRQAAQHEGVGLHGVAQIYIRAERGAHPLSARREGLQIKQIQRRAVFRGRRPECSLVHQSSSCRRCTMASRRLAELKFSGTRSLAPISMSNASLSAATSDTMSNDSRMWSSMRAVSVSKSTSGRRSVRMSISSCSMINIPPEMSRVSEISVWPRR